MAIFLHKVFGEDTPPVPGAPSDRGDSQQGGGEGQWITNNDAILKDTLEADAGLSSVSAIDDPPNSPNGSDLGLLH